VALSDNEVAIRIRLAGAKAAAAEAAAIEKEVSGLGSASERAARSRAVSDAHSGACTRSFARRASGSIAPRRA
jgi:hypothetical protein